VTFFRCTYCCRETVQPHYPASHPRVWLRATTAWFHDPAACLLLWLMLQALRGPATHLACLLPAAYLYPDNYTTSSGVNFTFNNIAVNFTRAEDMCNQQCGHLASYSSQIEQADVESWYIEQVSQLACSLSVQRQYSGTSSR
jgi:hypothetical protein